MCIHRDNQIRNSNPSYIYTQISHTNCSLHWSCNRQRHSETHAHRVSPFSHSSHTRTHFHASHPFTYLFVVYTTNTHSPRLNRFTTQRPKCLHLRRYQRNPIIIISSSSTHNRHRHSNTPSTQSHSVSIVCVHMYRSSFAQQSAA